ncbi:GGDEF domain-containing protein [Desulfopila inferna]|uniref:GGDEF domain-containing protein n=1 Tax=Desulfopila inferna TaxID=468528 RepID=UPI001963AD4F|nr:GGDEF domain-containing protein [Desulfopila inferna]MBM9603552.1 GGDEF domain-containing protein [Desulfopila inferna]
MRNTISNPIHEFIAAASKSYSYNVLENVYIWFGFLWGLPIPLVTIFFEMHVLEESGIDQGILTTLSSPVQWFFLAHPLLFGILFGILGTIRYAKDSELKSTISQLNDLTIHDALTGLKNRRYFAHIFHDECARSMRRREPLALLFLDIDFFKQINDVHGHHFGDIVLKELGAYLLKECRPYDTPVRWGGEEFLILLRATDEAAAVIFAERIRRGVESGLGLAIAMPVTISIGLAQYQQNDTLETLTERADQALYHAKQTGRNKTVSWKALQSARKSPQADRE